MKQVVSYNAMTKHFIVSPPAPTSQPDTKSVSDTDLPQVDRKRWPGVQSLGKIAPAHIQKGRRLASHHATQDSAHYLEPKIRMNSHGIREVIAICPGCKTMESLLVQGHKLLPTKRFYQSFDDGLIYHQCNCNGHKPCRLYNPRFVIWWF
jgi:hypothetical protein